MNLERYHDQRMRWPASGRHILARFDESTITVYQAYRSSIGTYAAKHQVFGGKFSYSRMSWIKPNFLWMMYRSGWGTKEGQEATLAVTIPRSLFDEMLCVAVPSSYSVDHYPDRMEWKRAVESSDVRLQWDPDHAPSGAPVERRAIQLGLRGEMLRRYGQREVVAIEDISDFVAEQRERAKAGAELLQTPREEVYIPRRPEAAQSVGLDEFASR
jgi:hypothetical protein